MEGTPTDDERQIHQTADSPPGVSSSFALRRVNTVALFVLGLAILAMGPGPRVGDGSQYYAMLITLAETGTPYFTDANADLYDSFVADQTSSFMDSAEIKRRFPQLVAEDGDADMPHFWFYSLLAVPFYHPLKWIGLSIGYAFNLLHLTLILLTAWVVRRDLGETGLTALLVFLVFSPLFWFLNKAHTELFTVLLCLMAVSRFHRRGYLSASVLFALAATQNIPFAFPALTCGLFFVWDQVRERRWSGLWAPRHVAAATAAGFVALLHPVYYLTRQGTVTPLMATGHAGGREEPLGLIVRQMTTWFIDPDVGLFANWFLSGPILAVTIYLLFRRQIKWHWPLAFLIVPTTVVFAYAHSNTVQFNHGGTLHISRYALWYFFAFLLPLNVVLLRAMGRRGRMWALASGFGIVLGLANILVYHPLQGESFRQQTMASRLLYRFAPDLYDPLPAIFVPRVTGRGAIPAVWAVSNEACTKVFVDRRYMTYADIDEVTKPSNCARAVNGARLYREAEEGFSNAPDKSQLYLNYGPYNPPPLPVYRVGERLDLSGFNEGRLTHMLESGWSAAAEFGRWSVGERAALAFELAGYQHERDYALRLRLNGYVPDGHPNQRARLLLNGELLGEILFEDPSARWVEFRIRGDQFVRRNELVLEVGNPVSPVELGLSQDPRKLGIGFVFMEIIPAEVADSADGLSGGD